MLTTLFALLGLIALICFLLRWWACLAPPPDLPVPTEPYRELPPARVVWLESDDDRPYNRAAFDRQITAMLRQTAQW